MNDQEPTSERLAFEQYAKDLFAEVRKHKDSSSIEVETVFRRWKPNVVISLLHKHNDLVYCGHPTVEKLGDGNLLFVPSTKCALSEGIEVFGMVDLPNMDETVQYSAVKVYVALVNDKLGHVHHLFPSLSAVHRRTFVENMAKTYASLAKTSPDLVPNYVLKSVRSTGLDPQTASSAAFRNVVQQLVQKAWEKEQRLVGTRLHSHSFDSEEFECIYKRFKYLSEQPGSGVHQLTKSTTVDISVLRKGHSGGSGGSGGGSGHAHHARLSLHGQRCFDGFCSVYKSLGGPSDIVDYVMGLEKGEFDIIQKREMTTKELPVLQTGLCYNGFKFNVKREDRIAEADTADVLQALFAEDVRHSYRFKRRYSFDCGLFTVDLTMVRHGDDKHHVFKPTPFVALEQMRKAQDIYEFEIESATNGSALVLPKQTGTAATTATTAAAAADTHNNWQRNPAMTHQACLHWMDECLRAMRKDAYFFGRHVQVSQYPCLLDESATAAVVDRFNALVCHGDRKSWKTPMMVNSSVGPNVVNMTHDTYNYVSHHFEDFHILMKTDGLRCVAFVEGGRQHAQLKQPLMHLFVQNATYPMTVALEENAPGGATSPNYVLDGELYTRNGQSTYYVFDVYYKDGKELLTRPLRDRLGAFTHSLDVKGVSLDVRKKAALDLVKYQELYSPALSAPAAAAVVSPHDDSQRQLKDAFECADRAGIRASDDGFILMHTGPLVVDIEADAEEKLIRAHGTKPHIMRKAEFDQGTHSIGSMSRTQQNAYVFCMKWKPEEECTIDFKVNLLDHDPALHGDQRRVRLCSKYKADSELNMFTLVQALCSRKITTALCPHTLPSQMQPFQPAEVYDYELPEPLSTGVRLAVEPTTGKLFTQRRELVHDGDIVEMRYDKQSVEWTPVRLRADKTEPNLYSVALANWKNIFNPVPRPLMWTPAPGLYDPSTLATYYTMRKQIQASSQLDNIHILLKQHLILNASRVWAAAEPRSRLSVFEVGCGRGTDLFHWNYVHKYIRSVAFYLGTDNDKSGLMRHDGAYFRYLRGNHMGGGPGSGARLHNLDTKYEFDALFLQADSRVSLLRCADQPWSSSTPVHHTSTGTTAADVAAVAVETGSAGAGSSTEELSAATAPQPHVSNHRLDYELLRYILFGKAPENAELASALPGRLVHPSYNLVSCQFALHYFADANHAFWKNLNMLLAPDGLFIATVPNGDFIRSQLASSEQKGEYVVPIRDAKKPSVSVPWYKYEKGTSRKSVFFQTPKISRREEPLFLKANVHKAVRNDFEVVYLNTFADYARRHKLSVYKTSCDARGIFHTASIDKRTLTHDFTGKHSGFAQPVHETREALQYSQEGHYVVILCKRNGRSAAEMDVLRKAFV